MATASKRRCRVRAALEAQELMSEYTRVPLTSACDPDIALVGLPHCEVHILFAAAAVCDVRAVAAGLLHEMVDLIESDNHTTVLIATKALAVVCRNSPANQALAIRRGLLAKCIALLSRCDDTYTAKWVILVINALVYENGEVRAGPGHSQTN